VTLPASTQPLSPGRRRRIPYSPALDGLRGAAVVAVLLFHGGVSWAQGGFLGVDAFFVLSGFLITSLLVQEWRDDGGIALGAFWARRARRLLPALLAVVALVAAYAVWAAPADARPGLRLDGLATLGYVANWRFVLSGATYFGRAELPSPLRHTWSLAIEEQFYLAWPLVVAALFRRGWSTARLLAASAAGVLASALLMAALFHPGSDPSRVYFGTDTHGQPLLVGAALAFALAAWRKPVRRGLDRLDGLAWVGAAVLLVSWVLGRGDDAWLYRGGFLLVALATAAVVAAVVTSPRGQMSRALSWEPLVVVGRLSYGLYLYHWPLFLWLNGERTGLNGLPLLVLRLVVTVAVSVLSYRFIELPVRRGALSNLGLAMVLPGRRRRPPSGWWAIRSRSCSSATRWPSRRAGASSAKPPSTTPRWWTSPRWAAG
jgi:peptidoglycan/LPS O-acetylase OafA/YrhL